MFFLYNKRVRVCVLQFESFSFKYDLILSLKMFVKIQHLYVSNYNTVNKSKCITCSTTIKKLFDLRCLFSMCDFIDFCHSLLIFRIQLFVIVMNAYNINFKLDQRFSCRCDAGSNIAIGVKLNNYTCSN